ncbi:hypothetical protein [Terribacillus saccharophilus]|uniref:hypothetical protein n=1 Tax=Terribacillus saccharophilus TaxID=361277 RepID=UPI003D2D0EF2
MLKLEQMPSGNTVTVHVEKERMQGGKAIGTVRVSDTLRPLFTDKSYVRFTCDLYELRDEIDRKIAELEKRR